MRYIEREASKDERCCQVSPLNNWQVSLTDKTVGAVGLGWEAQISGEDFGH